VGSWGGILFLLLSICLWLACSLGNVHHSPPLMEMESLTLTGTWSQWGSPEVLSHFFCLGCASASAPPKAGETGSLYVV
jgi:hypothetical protein